MSHPTPKKDPLDAQEFMINLTAQLDKAGFHAAAVHLRAEMPDSDVTNFGGSGSEKFITAIVTAVGSRSRQTKARSSGMRGRAGARSIPARPALAGRRTTRTAAGVWAGGVSQ